MSGDLLDWVLVLLSDFTAEEALSRSVGNPGVRLCGQEVGDCTSGEYTSGHDGGNDWKRLL